MTTTTDDVPGFSPLIVTTTFNHVCMHVGHPSATSNMSRYVFSDLSSFWLYPGCFGDGPSPRPRRDFSDPSPWPVRQALWHYMEAFSPIYYVVNSCCRRCVHLGECIAPLRTVHCLLNLSPIRSKSGSARMIATVFMQQ